MNIRLSLWCGLASVLLLTLSLSVQAKSMLNGFAIDKPLIPVDEIHQGGPPKDGIPSIDRPQFVNVDQVDWLKPQQQVLLLDYQGEVKAYPLAIMNWHEVVNDRFNRWPVLISYCPLCGTGMAFKAGQPSKAEAFGVSGLLYNSDVLLYDRKTESLWSQIRSQAVTGMRKGEHLQSLPLQQITWQQLRERYPQAKVLSRKTGYRRDYNRNPYQGYEYSEGLFFPVAFLNHQYHPKEKVLGITLNGQAKAYPFAELARVGGREIEDSFAGEKLRIEFDLTSRTGRIIRQSDNELLAAVNGFWFAWFGFYPKTEVFQAVKE